MTGPVPLPPVPPPSGHQGPSGKAIGIIAAAVGGVLILVILGVVLAVTLGGSRVDAIEQALRDGGEVDSYTDEEVRCIAEGIEASGLPEESKDRFADGDELSDIVDVVNDSDVFFEIQGIVQNCDGAGASDGTEYDDSGAWD